MASLALKRRKLEFDLQEGWSALIFLSLALMIVAWSINEAGYDQEMISLTFVTIGALVLGLFLAKSQLPWPLAHIFSLIFGVAWCTFLLSQQLPDTFTPRERLLELGYRIGLWFQQAVVGGARGTDPLMFSVVMCALTWLMTYLAMWFSFRAHNLWVALLPSGITFIFNLYYGPQRIGFALVPYLLLSLLFVVRFNLAGQQRGWRRRQVRYDTDIAFTFLRYGALLSLVTIALAWVVPSAASSEEAEVFFSRFTEPWDQVKSEWIRLFSTLQSERALPSYGVFGDTLNLGGPVNLGGITIMDVKSPTGRYWKAAVYEEYTGIGWTNENAETVFLDAGESAGEMVPYEARRTITQTFTLYMPDTIQLYALGQPERFSMPVKAALLRAESPDGEPLVESLLTFHNRYKMKDGESYMAVSNIASVDEGVMRLAGESYPSWIERYLQLPDDLPQRVQDLANEVTADYENPYDKAAAIQNYLREYTYNQKIEAPPEGVDRVDYFLFESKEGYCNYYASAMAVMARAAGIPARVAAGYTRGDWEEDAEVYRVREHHSHAWVEVYLPRFGWLEFEPTASEPVITRPRAPGEASSTSGSDVPPEDPFLDDFLNPEDFFENDPFDPELFAQMMREQQQRDQLRTLARVGGLLAIGVAVVLVAWWQGRKRMNEIKPAHAYHERMVRRADWWGCKTKPYYTAHEYAARLAAALANPDGERLIYRITNAYVGERFGNKNPARHQPSFAWRDLRPILNRWGIRNLWRRLWKID